MKGTVWVYGNIDMVAMMRDNARDCVYKVKMMGNGERDFGFMTILI